MHTQFWLERWQANETGFHQDQINTYLESWWGTLQTTPGDTVFVPLCGKSRDLLWLLSQGLKVIGVEISPLAVESFFKENDLPVDESDHGKFRRYTTAELTLLCGDFFDLAIDDLQTVTAVYDRASLIALPAEMRPSYTAHLAAILPQHPSTLLITMEYPAEDMQGPPFTVSEQEVNELYSDDYQIRCLSEIDVLHENPRFRERGLTRMIEKVFHLTTDQT